MLACFPPDAPTVLALGCFPPATSTQEPIRHTTSDSSRPVEELDRGNLHIPVGLTFRASCWSRPRSWCSWASCWSRPRPCERLGTSRGRSAACTGTPTRLDALRVAAERGCHGGGELVDAYGLHSIPLRRVRSGAVVAGGRTARLHTTGPRTSVGPPSSEPASGGSTSRAGPTPSRRPARGRVRSTRPPEAFDAGHDAPGHAPIDGCRPNSARLVAARLRVPTICGRLGEP